MSYTLTIWLHGVQHDNFDFAYLHQTKKEEHIPTFAVLWADDGNEVNEFRVVLPQMQTDTSDEEKKVASTSTPLVTYETLASTVLKGLKKVKPPKNLKGLLKNKRQELARGPQYKDRLDQATAARDRLQARVARFSLSTDGMHNHKLEAQFKECKEKVEKIKADIALEARLLTKGCVSALAYDPIRKKYSVQFADNQKVVDGIFEDVIEHAVSCIGDQCRKAVWHPWQLSCIAKGCPACAEARGCHFQGRLDGSR